MIRFGQIGIAYIILTKETGLTLYQSVPIKFRYRFIDTFRKRDPSKRASKVRKWMTYMTLFIAASVTIGALITLVYNFLAGELTLRFLLKILTVSIISIALFGYYLWDLRQDELETKAGGSRE